MDVYLDRARRTGERVEDLISRMNLEEKIAQLGGISPKLLMENGRFSADKANGILSNGIGEISAAARSSGLKARELSVLNNEIQKFLVEKTRLVISGSS